jgi:hypothetical protein
MVRTIALTGSVSPERNVQDLGCGKSGFDSFRWQVVKADVALHIAQNEAIDRILPSTSFFSKCSLPYRQMKEL